MQNLFYNFITDDGMKMVNINQIAAIEDVMPGIMVTLNVKNNKGDFISFKANLPWGTTTGQILAMAGNQS